MDYFELRQLASLYGLPCLSDNQVKTLAAFVQAACDKAIAERLREKSEEAFEYDPAEWSAYVSASSIASNAFKPIYTPMGKI